MDNFAKEVINNGGVLKPLLILSKDMDFPSLTNPTILNYQDKLIVNIRNVNYSLYHSELNRYEHTWGPLVYIHPENDLKRKTVNYLCELTSDKILIHIQKLIHQNVMIQIQNGNFMD